MPSLLNQGASQTLVAASPGYPPECSKAWLVMEVQGGAGIHSHTGGLEACLTTFRFSPLLPDVEF